MHKTARKLLSLFIVLAIALNVLPIGGVPVSAAGTISLNVMETAYTQDFDTLASSGTAEASTLPTGWDLLETGTGKNTSYAAGTGSDTAGNTYSFGASGNAERAFGGLQSGSVNPTIGSQFTNNTGSSILSLSVSYTGEQWRMGAAGRVDQLNFQYSTDATSLDTGAWIDVDALDFVAPAQTGMAGARDGNAAANRTAISAVISGIEIPNTASFWIRWTDINPSGSDDGLAVDDFSLTPSSIVPDVAPIVTIISPASGATDVFIDAPIIATFSEPVNVAADWFTFTCATGTAPTLTASAGPASSFTLTHTEDFPETTSCTFAIPDPSKVTDVDGSADAMVAPFSSSFTVETYVDLCTMDYTPIYTIQGTGTSTTLSGQQVHVEGVVVGDFEDAQSNLKGFYLQDPTGDGNTATSDGIFIYNNNTENRVSLGDLVHVVGTATEAFDQTQISSVSDWRVCDVDQTITPVDITMPFADAAYLERYEGMLVRFPQDLVIAEYYQYDQFGEVILALPLEGESRPFTGTAVDEPGDAANARTLTNTLRRITLDDNNSKQNPDVLRHPNGKPFSLENRFRGGDEVTNTVGVLAYSYSKYRILPTGPAEYTAVNPRPAAPDAVGGTVRVAAMNTLNYFLTGDPMNDSTSNDKPDDNICGPSPVLHDCRGWDIDQPAEFMRQRAKLLKALEGLNADVIGLNEIENTTGVEPLADIVAGLPGYAYINTGTIGTDAIKVGMIYRPTVVTPAGAYQTLDTADDPRFLDNKNRPALAQTFVVNATGEKFTVVVNHFKSKGSECSGDPDTDDGQGNCSQTRANAAAALVDWLDNDPTGSGDTDFIILGDLNSYAMEDTIDVIKAGPDDTQGTDDDYTNLIAKYQGAHAYSYTFDGQAGYLDHALASASMVGQVTGATEWHINSDEPDILDYDTSFKPAAQEALFEENAFRTSDHDPVIVGFNLAPTPVNNAPVALDDAYETDEDDDLIVAAPGVLANDTDDDGDTLAASLVAGPQYGTLVFNSNGGFQYTPSADFNGSDTFTYTVSDGKLTDTATVTITVKSIDDGYDAVITKNKFSPEEGETVTFTASLIDLDTEQLVDFSDGAVNTWNFEPGHNSTGEVVQHAFSDEDTYVVTLIVDDPVYGVFTATTMVPVKNANPTVNVIAPVTIGQREWVEQAGTFTDPGLDEQFTATVDYGDGTGPQPLALGDGTFNLLHQYFTAGNFTITIVLCDGDGGEDTLTIAVTVEGRQIIFLPYLQQ